MKRWKLLAALSISLGIQSLASAQSDGPLFSRSATAPRTQSSIPARLPDPGSALTTITAEPKIKSPTGEIVVPQKDAAKPTVTIEELPCDPRPLKQRLLRKPSNIEEPATESPARSALAADNCARIWFVPEWLLWKTSGMHLPALVTGGPLGVAQANTGVLGVGGTRVLYGGDTQLDEFRSGIRVRLGYWFEPSQTFGIDAGIFYLGQKSSDVAFGNSGNPFGLARPFSNPVSGIPASEVVSFATLNADGTSTSNVSGGIIARATNDFWGLDINLRRYLAASDSMRLDGLLGFRYQRVRDTLETDSSSLINTAGAIGDLAAGTVLRVNDLFHTTSNFYGGQLGLVSEWNIDRWFVGLNGKVALGVVEHEVLINGLTTITPSGGTAVVTTGGLLAQNTNIGRHRTDRFSVIPELGLNLGYQLSSNVRLFAGYSVLYWSNVVRAGDQIDLAVNPSQLQRSVNTQATLVGPPRPAYGSAFRESGYWAHGVNLGLDFRW